jgi:hypothetical protein
MLERLLNRFEDVNWRIFGAFLLLGVLSGAFFGGLSASAAPSPKAPNGQRNFLVAVVDDAAGESTALQALWLAAAVPEEGAISWMPLYPEPLDQPEARYAEVHEALMVNPEDEGAWNGLGLLRQQGVWWDEVILLDNAALTVVAQLLGAGVETGIQSAVEPQNALHAQVRFIRQFCMNAPALGAEVALDQVLALTTGTPHVRSTMSQFEMIALWDQFGANGFALSCEHPWAAQPADGD